MPVQKRSIQHEIWQAVRRKLGDCLRQIEREHKLFKGGENSTISCVCLMLGLIRPSNIY